MKITSGRNPLAVGVDYREEYHRTVRSVCLLSEGAVRAEALCCQGRDAGISGPSGYGEGDD